MSVKLTGNFLSASSCYPALPSMKINVRLTPSASRNHLELVTFDDSSRTYKAWVTAIPEDGKANAALIKLLAKELGVPKTALNLISGATSRDKIFQI